MYQHLESTHNMTAPRLMMPFILQLLKPHSLLDVGCGLATWIAAGKELGVTDVLGVDGDFVDRSLLKVPEHQFMALDLRLPFDLGRSFDVAISLEVAEHLPESSADGLIDSLCRHADKIVFSAANPGQDGGQNHINCQWSAYWEAKFRERGYLPYDLLRPVFWEQDEIEWWYRQNMVIYAKAGVLPYPSQSPLRTIHPAMLMEKMRRIQELKAKLQEQARRVSA
jgi:SAM-dependent methyltransferase